MSDVVLGEETWPAEGQAAINDIIKHVAHAQLSEQLQCSNGAIYINLTTLEQSPYCVEMSAAGFRVVGRKHDDNSLAAEETVFYETPYALLNIISKRYKESFGGELMSRLLDLAKQTDG